MSKKVTVKGALAFIALGVVAIFCGVSFLGMGPATTNKLTRPSTTAEYAKTSVMITLPDGHSGGSGVILTSTPSLSIILTNVHICSLIQTGGIVKTEKATYPVSAYRVYSRSDLCTIQVQANLGVNTAVASEAPALYSPITVAGHPALLPTAITRGHFSGRMTIQLMVDLEPCDGTEKDNDAMMCFFMGGKPVLRSFDSQFTTALIMPGSSGSGVFNEQGELAGLVFAGQGDLGFGFIVPFEYVKDFLMNQDKYPVHIPDSKAKPINYLRGAAEIAAACRSGNLLVPVSICSSIAFQEVLLSE